MHGIALLFPDTSPRGAGIDGEDDDWDFGTGIFRLITPLTHRHNYVIIIHRCGILSQCYASQVRRTLQHAHSHYAGAPTGPRDRRDTHRTFTPLYLYFAS